MDGDLGAASVPMIESRCIVTPKAGRAEPTSLPTCPKAMAGHNDSLRGSSRAVTMWLAHSRLQEA